MTKYYKVVTLGCPKNSVDSEQMKGYFSKSGFLAADEFSQANIILINTCGFIEEARRESIDTILELGRWKEKGNCESLIVTGCMVQKYADELAEHLPEVDYFLGTGDVAKLPIILSSLESGHQRITVGDPNSYLFDDELPRVPEEIRHYAYLKIAEGCSNYCSYCVIPSMKGKYRSRKLEAIIKEAVELSTRGVKELILVAQDTTLYGIDIYGRYMLSELLRELCKIESIHWIRLLYCYPNHISDELLETIKNEPKVCNYLDIPLQHISDRILRDMNRAINRNKIEELIARIRSFLPDITLRSTFIIGFPGETAQEFQELCSFIKDIGFDRAGFFAYSREKDTPAGEMPRQIPSGIKQKRVERVTKIQEKLLSSKQAAFVGKAVKVIVDGPSIDYAPLWEGRTEGDAPEIDGVVYFLPQALVKPGDIIIIQVSHSLEFSLMGEIKG